MLRIFWMRKITIISFPAAPLVGPGVADPSGKVVWSVVGATTSAPSTPTTEMIVPSVLKPAVMTLAGRDKVVKGLVTRERS